MSEKDLLPAEIAPLLEQISTIGPKMNNVRNNAVAEMEKLTAVNNDDDLEEANELLIASASAIPFLESSRKPITKKFDEIASFLMQPEKDVKAHDVRIRALVQGYKQKKVEENKKKEDDARKFREKEDYKVDVLKNIRKALADMLINRVNEVDKGSADHFKKATGATFDTIATQYMNFKATLKQEIYDKCFVIPFDLNKISKEEATAHIEFCKAEEPFGRWTENVIEAITPVINEWRGRIPDLKEELLNIEKAKGEEKEKLEKEKKERDEAEALRKKEELEKVQNQAKQEIEQQAEVDKIGNSFQEQGVVQENEAVGPVKKVLRFEGEPKLYLKALANVMYHVFLSEGFSILKKDRQGNIVKNANGDTEYIDAVAFWMEAFISKKCDAVIPNTVVKTVAKVIIKK